MDKKIRTYTSAVRRRLNLPKDLKDRCLSDLETTIHARLEKDESWEAVKESLGSPKKVAEELNTQMQEYAYRKSPWRFLFLILSVLSAIWLAFYAGIMMFVRFIADAAGSVGIIGGADGPTAIMVSVAVGPDWDLILMSAVLAVGILGYICLCRCKPKK